MFSESINQSIAIFLLRAVAGILFFYQGYDKLFIVKISNVVRTFGEPMRKLKIPFSILKPAIGLASLIEFICGGLLFLGLFKNISLYLLAGNLILVAFIFSNIKPMWDLQYFFPRLIIIALLLFYTATPDIISMDYLLKVIK